MAQPEANRIEGWTLGAVVLAILLVALLTAKQNARNAALRVVTTDNPYIDVEILFTVDSCTVYRFKDPDTGEKHYISPCSTFQKPAARPLPKVKIK